MTENASNGNAIRRKKHDDRNDNIIVGKMMTVAARMTMITATIRNCLTMTKLYLFVCVCVWGGGEGG